MNSTQFCFYRDQLTEAARRLVWQHGEGGPPYDPFKIARALNVTVRLEYLDGLLGYTDCENSQFSAILASQSSVTRQRFTLAHELGHVLLMRNAQRGIAVSLRRYRGASIPDTAHQDPVEEAVCNAFAAELLVPTDEIRQALSNKRVDPTDVVEMARSYNVSMQVSAKKIVRILGKERIGFSLWDCVRRKWPATVWSTGLQVLNSQDLAKKLGSLVIEAINSHKDLIECLQIHTRKESLAALKTDVHVTPRLQRSALVCLRERFPDQSARASKLAEPNPEKMCKPTPAQLTLF